MEEMKEISRSMTVQITILHTSSITPEHKGLQFNS